VVPGFAVGAGYLLRGLRLAFAPGVRLYALGPILITTVVFALAVWAGVHYFGALLDGLLPASHGTWGTALRTLLWPLFAIATVLIVYFGFTLAANLVAAPFNELLAERVEAHLGGSRQQPGGLADLARDFVPAMLSELRKFSHYLLWAIPFGLAFLVPGLNLAAPFLWMAFMAWMLALEYVAYPMANHRLRFATVRRTLRARRMLGLGFGAGVLGATLIPFLNILAMPAAVAGATAMWHERLRDETPG